MAGTVIHAQYNSPLPLYSQASAQEEFQRATGQHSPGLPASPGHMDLSQHSGAYKLLHSNGHLPPEHSATLEEIRSNEYPHYKGFVDPNQQSPSFKRLQYFSGVGDEPGSGSPHRSYSPRPGGGHSPVHMRQWYPDEPPVAQRDPASANEPPLDSAWAVKIAAAERPNVPHEVVPDWVARSRAQNQQWQAYQGAWQDQYQQQVFAPPAPASVQITAPAPAPPPKPAFYRSPSPPPSSLFRPVQFKTVADTSSHQDKWEQHYGGPGGQFFGQATTQHRPPRPRSVESFSQRQKQQSKLGGEKEPWLKPYIAPNLLHTKFSGSSQNIYKSIPPRPTSGFSHPGFGGTYYGGAGGHPDSQSFASSTTRQVSYQEQSQQQRGPSPIVFGSGYGQSAPAPPPRSISPHGPVPFSAAQPRSFSPPARPIQAPWSSSSVSSQQQRTQQQSSSFTGAPAQPPSRPYSNTVAQAASLQSKPLWQGESEAWQRKREMEDEIRRRGLLSSQHQAAPVAFNQFNDTSGSSTKSQTQGSYVDPQGQQVQYVKEVYTSSDPHGGGGQFSALSQQEQRALEQPLQPGVVSRHTTSKYYKRSTYTSQTSSGPAGAAPTAAPAGISQF